MLKNIFNFIFSFKKKKDIKNIKQIIEKINSFEIYIKKLTNEELKNKTIEFKKRFCSGETLSSILPEAFACVREASMRTIGMRHFDVQLIGGYILHNGKIAEMKTGEGKTIVATLSAYLNAIPGKGVHIVTVNDYLAKRDMNWMLPIYKQLGLTVGNINNNSKNEERKNAYNCDITYVTNNEIGFDYLRDSLVTSKHDKVMRELNYVIIDEVDSILIDEARTPLIISGFSEKSTDKYYSSNRIIPFLKCRKITENEEIKAKYNNIDLSKGYDYLVDEKNRSVVLTEEGVQKSEKILGIKNIYDDLQSEWVHHITQAAIAHNLYHKNVEYVIKNGEIIIVDEFTGRLMPGRRWSDGLHQAIEAKENLKIANENQTLATITFQNFFRSYNKISGMTGTAMTESEEFFEIYKLDVVDVPTNKQMIREDYPDVVYMTEKEKDNAIINEIEMLWKNGRPVLVGTRSIDKSEKISIMLKNKHIPHKVLNAKHHDLEAQIISNAGEKKSVTIATNMAGRGTDIILGNGDVSQNEEIKKKGGLHVIGTERHESRRIDNQLRGRAGRQGDPGSTRFFISMEDELMRLFGSDKISAIMKKIGFKDGENIQHPWISKIIENAQKKVEGMNFDIRKHLIDFDDVMNKQREAIYKLRNEILYGDDISIIIKNMIKDSIYEKINKYKYLKKCDFESMSIWLLRTFGIKYDFKCILNLNNKTKILNDIYVEIIKIYESMKNKNTLYLINKLQRIILLKMIDSSWRDHLNELDQLKRGIGFRAYAQKDPKIEYQKESFSLFESMMKRIRENTIEYIFKINFSNIFYDNNIINFTNTDHIKNNRDIKNISRNDVCYCGSKKKYKKCCGL
jgi:preprotein translocase subunit SecA